MRIQSLLAILLATAVLTSGCFGSSKSDDGGDQTEVQPDPQGQMALGFTPPDRDNEGSEGDALEDGGDGGNDDGGDGGDEEEPDDGGEESSDDEPSEPGFFQSLFLNPWDITGHGVTTQVGAEGFVFEAGIQEWRPQPGNNAANLPEPVISRYCVLIERAASNNIDVTEPSLAWEKETIRSWNLDVQNYKGYQYAMGDDFNPNTPEAWMHYNEGDIETFPEVPVSKFRVALAPHDENVLCDKDSVAEPSMDANIWLPAGHGASENFWPVAHLNFTTDDGHTGIWEYHAPKDVQPPAVGFGPLHDELASVGPTAQNAQDTAHNVADDPKKAADDLLTPDQLPEGTGVYTHPVKLPYMAGDSFVAEPEAHLILAIFGLDIVVEGWSPGEDITAGEPVQPHVHEFGTDAIGPWTKDQSNQYFSDGKFGRLFNKIHDGIWGSDEEEDDGAAEIVPVLGQEVGGIPQSDAREISDEYTYYVPANPVTGEEAHLVSQAYAIELSSGVPLPTRVTVGVKQHVSGAGQGIGDDASVSAGELARVQPSVYTGHVMLSLEMVGIVNTLNQTIANTPGMVPDPAAFMQNPAAFVQQTCGQAGVSKECQDAQSDAEACQDDTQSEGCPLRDEEEEGGES